MVLLSNNMATQAGAKERHSRRRQKEKERNCCGMPPQHSLVTPLSGKRDVRATELMYLKELIPSPDEEQLSEPEERVDPAPVRWDALPIALEISRRLRPHHKDARVLINILTAQKFLGLLNAHDRIAKETAQASGREVTHKPPDDPPTAENMEAIRMVGLTKNPNEPLGLTVKQEGDELVVSRILAGGFIDKQGLLHVGDVIREVNGRPAYTPEELQQAIGASNTVTLKVVPGAPLKPAAPQCYVRAMFAYNPMEDKLLPCPEVGLPFEYGDVLKVVDRSDPNWWQAQRVGVNAPAGLIPSQELEERRKAYVPPEADYVHKIGICGTLISKRKRKQMYRSKQNNEFDKAELVLYEEVARMPPFQRKVLCLIGCAGVGRRTLKNRIIETYPDKFGTTLPHTSRPRREDEEDGQVYHFTTHEAMEEDIRNVEYLEYGTHNGHLYGTKLDSIRSVIRSGKVCVLDCSPVSLKTLYNSAEFHPYVVFLAAPGVDDVEKLYRESATTLRNSSRSLTFDRNSSRYSSRRGRTIESLNSLYDEEDHRRLMEESARLQRAYEKYFDLMLINEDPDETYRRVMEAVMALETEPQWVPVTWVY
ncbi:protein PALS2-like [Amphibalanus amphitrite]|uniref:protein PALS2-like n=1 Tax=Amphibalanus amphitrite TaxID=1232801 RepID=UPI001C906C0D|nr:protein PALS2-like [Amphibalanus amphitrite]